MYDAEFDPERKRTGMSSRNAAIAGLYLMLLAGLASRAYFYSQYDLDMMGYIGNALAISGASVREIHDTAYRALSAEVPGPLQDHLLGRDAPVGMPDSRQDRSVNPYHYAEYLPCFAIRPIYNELIYLLHFRLGVGLVRSTIVIPVLSYWLTGALIFFWLSSYLGFARAAAGSLLLMLAPPILGLARFNGPDALACLTVLSAIYLIFERNSLFWGLTLLLLAIYVRTDNVLMAIAVLAYASLVTRQLEKKYAAILALLGVTSVAIINHFAGDYGIRMLYYRSFIAVPIAPGEMVAQFGMIDYLRAFRIAVSQTVNSYFPLFALMGVVGYLGRKTGTNAILAALNTFYVAAHFVLFPSGQERFWGPFYIGSGMMMAIAACGDRQKTSAPSPEPAENRFPS